MPEAKTLGKITIRLCSNCEGAAFPANKAAVQEALNKIGLGESVTIRAAECLGACKEPGALSIQSSGGASYVFSGVSIPQDADDLAATCALYMKTRKGWIENALECGRLRHCLRARIPALDG